MTSNQDQIPSLNYVHSHPVWSSSFFFRIISTKSSIQESLCEYDRTLGNPLNPIENTSQISKNNFSGSYKYIKPLGKETILRVTANPRKLVRIQVSVVGADSECHKGKSLEVETRFV